MKTPRVFGWLLATSITVTALAGCPAPSMAPGGATNTTTPSSSMMAQPVTLAASSSNAASAAYVAASLADEQDMDDYGATVDGAGVIAAGGANYQVDALSTTAAVTASGTASVTAPVTASGTANVTVGAVRAKIVAAIKAKIVAREKAIALKRQQRLQMRAAEVNAIAKGAKGAHWVENGDGTKTLTFETDLTKTTAAGTLARHVKVVRTVEDDDNSLVSGHMEFSESWPNGMSHSATRDKVLQADGSYQITFHGEFVYTNGSKRDASWNKTISADDQVSGTGTITFTNKDGATNTVTVTLGGTEETQSASTSDGGQTSADVSATTEASVTSPAASPSPSPASSTSPSPAASASPAATASPSASPAASASPTVSASASATASASTAPAGASTSASVGASTTTTL